MICYHPAEPYSFFPLSVFIAYKVFFLSFIKIYFKSTEPSCQTLHYAKLEAVHIYCRVLERRVCGRVGQQVHVHALIWMETFGLRCPVHYRGQAEGCWSSVRVGEQAGIRMGQEPSFTPADGLIESRHGDHSEVAGFAGQCSHASAAPHFNAVSVWLRGSFREKSGMTGRLRSLENWCSQEGISKTANQREGEALSSRGSSCWGGISVLRRFFFQDAEQIW